MQRPDEACHLRDCGEKARTQRHSQRKSRINAEQFRTEVSRGLPVLQVEQLGFCIETKSIEFETVLKQSCIYCNPAPFV